MLILQTPYGNTSSALPYPGNVIAYPFTGTTPAPVAGCDIQFGNEVLPFHQPIALPSAVVIDLRYSSSNVQYLAGGNLGSTAGLLPPNIDISFSPRGSVAGATGGLGAFYFCIRDLEDATGASSYFNTTPPSPRDPSDVTCKGDCLILALNPATGLVQTYPANVTDARFINSNAPQHGDKARPGQDGLASTASSRSPSKAKPPAADLRARHVSFAPFKSLASASRVGLSPRYPFRSVSCFRSFVFS